MQESPKDPHRNRCEMPGVAGNEQRSCTTGEGKSTSLRGCDCRHDRLLDSKLVRLCEWRRRRRELVDHRSDEGRVEVVMAVLDRVVLPEPQRKRQLDGLGVDRLREVDLVHPVAVVDAELLRSLDPLVPERLVDVERDVQWQALLLGDGQGVGDGDAVLDSLPGRSSVKRSGQTCSGETDLTCSLLRGREEGVGRITETANVYVSLRWRDRLWRTSNAHASTPALRYPARKRVAENELPVDQCALRRSLHDC